MMYEDVVRDFAHRTKRNLAFIENHVDDPEADVYEVTQLINSMLGLLVFPQQKYIDRIPRTPLNDLVKEGWPRIRTTYGRLREDTLYQLIRNLRNAISHYNIKFRGGPGHITGITIWNNDRRGNKTWESQISLPHLKQITERFIEMLETEYFIAK